ncbi:MAG: MarR family transcriptional regulator [Acidobacteria bacterium]|nr:MarR family transcriptional regulator [Acidobacteriota bacterium]MCH8268881.1 MarR family transcriptional regulator [Acidobacteriota bacterium]
MATLKDRIVDLLRREIPGLTDREITDRLMGPNLGQQAVNQATRALAVSGTLIRRKRHDGKFGNYLGEPSGEKSDPATIGMAQGEPVMLSEDDIKRKLKKSLESKGWVVHVQWGRVAGIDVEATREGSRWVIEAKGCGSSNPMRHNYFLAVLGELLQRMDDPNARYSIALPDRKQFRNLWQRLPELAKSRTRVSALFVDPLGQVEEVGSGNGPAV